MFPFQKMKEGSTLLLGICFFMAVPFGLFISSFLLKRYTLSEIYPFLGLIFLPLFSLSYGIKR